MAETGSEKSNDTPKLTWQQVLADSPPGAPAMIVCRPSRHYTGSVVLPDIEIFCTECQQFLNFQSDTLHTSDEWQPSTLEYVCRNCRKFAKIYAIQVGKLGSNGNNVTLGVRKFGEIPPYGPHTPPQVLELIRPDKAMYLKARRAESQGMGIGAFAYYRRVVENQKDRLFDQIIAIAQKEEFSNDMIEQLERAKGGFQFKKSVKDFKALIPASLLIKGHNPLTLIHDALSKGLHEHDDEKCLTLAQHIRIILSEMAERMAQARKDDNAIKEAIGALRPSP